MKQIVDKFIESKKDEMLKDLSLLIKYESTTDNLEENIACLKAFNNLAKAKGFTTKTTKNNDVLIIEMGEGKETLGILAHLDVVDTGDLEKWETDPFEAVIKNNYIYGRGTEDDKGACVMSLYAMEAVKNLNLPFKRKVQLIVGTKEEEEWTDIAHFKEEYHVPDFGFSPDGSFPIYNEEKGYADVVLFFKEEGIVELKAGESYNTIPSKAEITLSNKQKIVAEGTSAHSSMPEKGDNAISNLSEKLLETEEAKNKSFVLFINDYFSHNSFGEKLLRDKDEDCESRTTLVPTVLSLTEEGIKLVINIRHNMGITYEDIFNAFELLKTKYKFTFNIEGCLNPMYVDPGLFFLEQMDNVQKEYKIKGGFKAASGSSYAKSMDNFVSWGPVMENEESTAHMENERLSMDTMILATKIYAYYIYKMAIKEGE